MDATHKIAQYLGEAKATEDTLVRVLQSQIAMTPAGSYRSALEAHLEETRGHSRRLTERPSGLPGERDPLRLLIDLGEEIVGQTLALARPRSISCAERAGREKVLENAKHAAATESLEIATYLAIEELADADADADAAGAGAEAGQTV